MILVVCATEAELKCFQPPVGTVVLAAGIGPVEAAASVSRALARGNIDIVINVGIGGAFRGCAAIGDALLVTHETLAELGIEGGRVPELPNGMKLISEAHADCALVERLRPCGLPEARGVTVATVTASTARANELAARFDAAVESMEGFAVLRSAQIAGVPAVEIRGISNYVGPRATAEWNFSKGAGACAKALQAAVHLLLDVETTRSRGILR